MKIKDTKLYKPYSIVYGNEKNKSFLMFLNHAEKPLTMEHNSLINSLSIHRWLDLNAKVLGKTIHETDHNFVPFEDLQYVIRTIFEHSGNIHREER